jgi:twinkle protein
MTEGLLPAGVPYVGRGLTAATTAKFGYTVTTTAKGNEAHIAPYRNAAGEVVGQKLRGPNKAFKVVGDLTDGGLFGQHLWRDGGKRVVVTEGEIDAMSVSQAFGLSWPAVSVPNGAQGAKKAVQRSLEWLSAYETVVFAFDMDEPGRKAAAECAALLPPGKAKIAELGMKDANELIVAGKADALRTAIYEARSWRPGGIVNGADLWAKITERREPGLPYPWKALTAVTGGQMAGTLVTWTSGTGMGKSTFVSQVAYEMAFLHGKRVGYVALEENVGRAAMRFLSHKLGRLVHIDGSATLEEMRRAFDETLATGRCWFHDHFGSTDSDDLLSKLRYLVVGCECEVLVLDHVSIVVSGMDLAGDERRTIDNLMTALRTLVEETGVILHLVSHLRRPQGTSHEEGGRVNLADLRGSAAIAQLSDMVIGLERNQQAEGDEGRQVRVRVLKNRETGETGRAGTLEYDRGTGRLSEVEEGGRGEDGGDVPF